MRRFFLAVASLAAVLAVGCGDILGIPGNYLLCGPEGAGGCGGAISGAGGGDAGPDAPR